MEMTYRDKFIRSKKRNLSENTLKGYYNDIKNFLEPIMEERNCSELEAIQFVDGEYVDDYIATKKKDNGEEYSKSSLNRELASLTSFYDYMMDTLNKVSINPFKKIERYNDTESKERESLSLEETRKLIDATYRNYRDKMYGFSSARTRLIVSLMTSTGMRIEEILSLEMCFIEQVGENYFINIPSKLAKNGEARRVPICGKVKSYYHEYLKERNKLGIESELLILSNNKKKFHKKNSMESIQKYVERIGVKKNIGNHSFRHTFRTVATMQNVNEGLICCIGGWSRKSLGSQSNIYLHDTEELDNIKVEICEKIL